MTNERIECGSVATEIGVVHFTVSSAGLATVTIDEVDGVEQSADTDDRLDQIKGELAAYFSGCLRNFSVPIDLERQSDFSRRVLGALLRVGYGETVTYGELALRAGYPRAARAVGRVMARNPVPIVIPCHRVVGCGGKMTGYSGGHGIETKEWLLAHEQQVLHGCHNDPHQR